MQDTNTPEKIKEAVRERYGDIARQAVAAPGRASCCGPGQSSCCSPCGSRGDREGTPRTPPS